MSALQIDIDAEAIHFDGRWMRREDLAQAIRGMLDAGDYNIGRHSAALEALGRALADVRTVTFRVSAELAGALEAAAAAQGVTHGAILRAALQARLQPAEAAAPPLRPAEPEIPIAVETQEVPSAHGEESWSNAVPPPGLQPAPAPGPGALRAAGVPGAVAQATQVVTEAASPEEAAHAVSLTPRKQEGDGQGPVERRWFGS